MNQSSTRRIIRSTAAVLWIAAIPITAAIELTLHWYLAIWLATAMASFGVVACLMDSMARAREAEKQAAGRAAYDDSIKKLCAAISENTRRIEVATDRHATRMEAATTGHGERLRSHVFTLERWMANTWRGETLGKYDAAREAEERNAGSDTGPLPTVSGR